jgi:hypothetical protein
MDQILSIVQTLERESSTRLTTLETQRVACRAEVVRIHEALFGNGKPGALSDIHEIRTLGNLKSKWFWLLATALPATASGLLGAIFGAVAARVF